MKNNSFKACAYDGAPASIYISTFIELSDDGTRARYLTKQNFDCDRPAAERLGRWQNVKYTNSGRAFITCSGRPLWFDNFIKMPPPYWGGR